MSSYEGINGIVAEFRDRKKALVGKSVGREFIRAVSGGQAGEITTEIKGSTRHALRSLLYGPDGLFNEQQTPYREVAKQLDMDYANFNRLLNGARFPKETTVKEWAFKLNVPESRLLDNLVVHVYREIFRIGQNVQFIQPPKCVTVQDAATLLGIRGQSVTKLIRSGELPALRDGRAWKIPEESLDKYIDKYRS